MRFLAIAENKTYQLSTTRRLINLHKRLNGHLHQVYFKTSNGIVGNQEIVTGEDISFVIQSSGQELSGNDIERLTALSHSRINDNQETTYV